MFKKLDSRRVYKDLIISTIVDRCMFAPVNRVYKDLIISTIVDSDRYEAKKKLSIKTL